MGGQAPTMRLIPYPDFLHVVYLATADRYDAQQREANGYELDARFQPLTTVALLPLSKGERVFLTAGVRGTIIVDKAG